VRVRVTFRYHERRGFTQDDKDDDNSRVEARDVREHGVHDSEARIRKDLERRDQVENPETAICKARLDQQGENLLGLDGKAVSTEVINQLVSFPPRLESDQGRG